MKVEQRTSLFFVFDMNISVNQTHIHGPRSKSILDTVQQILHRIRLGQCDRRVGHEKCAITSSALNGKIVIIRIPRYFTKSGSERCRFFRAEFSQSHIRRHTAAHIAILSEKEVEPGNVVGHFHAGPDDRFELFTVSIVVAAVVQRLDIEFRSGKEVAAVDGAVSEIDEMLFQRFELVADGKIVAVRVRTVGRLDEKCLEPCQCIGELKHDAVGIVGEVLGICRHLHRLGQCMLFVIETERVRENPGIFKSVFDLHAGRDLLTESIELLFDTLLIGDESVVKVVLCDAHVILCSLRRFVSILPKQIGFLF